MIQFRSFLNVDPPAIADIWRRQPRLRGMFRDVTPEVLERFVFSKPYFHRQQLVLAIRDGIPVGLVHVGFAPSPDGSRLVQDTGIVAMLIALPGPEEREVLAELLRRGEELLKCQGAQTIYALAHGSRNPFYRGFYGGSAVSGVLQSDITRQAVFAESNYLATQNWLVLERTLLDFRPQIDRQLIRIRRTHQLGMTLDPPARSWWDACETSSLERVEFAVAERDNGRRLSHAVLWNMELLSRHWNTSAVGLTELEVNEEVRRRGHGTFLIGEALRHLQSHQVSLVDVHVAEENDAARGLFEKLGFAEVDRSTELRKLVQAG